jgi:hypothetical protein
VNFFFIIYCSSAVVSSQQVPGLCVDHRLLRTLFRAHGVRTNDQQRTAQALNAHIELQIPLTFDTCAHLDGGSRR